MELSKLVEFRKMLTDMSVRHPSDVAHKELGDIVQNVENYVLQFGEMTWTLKEDFAHVNSAFTRFQTSMDKLIAEVDKIIEQYEPYYFSQSYRLYKDGMAHEETEYILNRRFGDMPEDVYQFLANRLHNYDNWKHAGLIIRPGLEEFHKNLVACDPLYLVDQTHDLLKPAIDSYNEVYQKRLRVYTINEQSEDPILGKLPDKQFGFVLAYNIFNFRPFEVIKTYLTEIYQKLRPGGMLVMTFNDCDRAKGVMLVEQHFCCYTPGYLVRELAQSLGYLVAFSWTDQGPSTWLELQKPGNFESLRGGQALAKIIPK
jgi:SAM-dependent methyltransferase